MEVKFLDLKKQYKIIKPFVDKRIGKVIDSQQFINGKQVKEFERRFANLINKKYCVAVGNGTDGLFLTYKAYGMNCVWNVLSVPNTFIATTEMISAIEANLYFTDVKEDGLIDIFKFDKNKKIDAVVPVHLYGNPCDMDEVFEFAEKHEAIIIEDCCQAHLAEYSYQKVPLSETGVFSFYPGKNLGCYDEDTEIFTEEGWKFFKDLKKDDKVAILNDNQMNFEKPKEIMEYDYSGDMFCFKNKAIDLLVTPNHNMYIKTWEKDEFYLRNAWDLVRASQWTFKQDFEYICKDDDIFEVSSIKQKSNGQGGMQVMSPIHIDMKLWLEFLGYWLSEGHIQKNKGKKGGGYKISISQSKKSKFYKDMLKCIEKLPFKIFMEKNGERFSFYSQSVYINLKELGKCKEKYIPLIIKQLPKNKLMIMLEALIKGDGSFNPDGTYKRYYTISKRLADDIQEISIKCGIYTTITFRDNKYIIDFNKKMNKTMVRGKHVKVVPYKGKVYCCETSTHILYIRRNGRVCWCGNSYGDAGAVVTNNKEIAEKIAMLRDHGRNEKYKSQFEGYNSRMDEIQAAVLNAKLNFIKKWTKLRQEKAKTYIDLIAGYNLPIIPPAWDLGKKHVFHLYVIRCKKRDKLQKYLLKNGVETGIHYPYTLHKQNAYKIYGFGKYPMAEQLSQEILSLPMYPELKDEEIGYVVNKIKEFYR